MAIDNIQDFNNEIEELRRTMRLFGQDTGDSGAKLKQFGRATADSVEDLSRATRSFVDNVGRGSTNMSSMSGVVGSATNALGKLLNVVPGIGRGLKFLSDSVGEAAQAVLQLTDEVGQTFNEFSRVGALTADNIEGLRQQFLASGQSLQNFRKTIIENSVSFAQFGGMVSQGTNTFANSVGKLADPSSKLGDSLRRLGLNTEDIVESGASYLRQQLLLGRNEFVTQQSLTSGTQNLVLEMDRLAKITGANRKQLQEQREAELREGVFGASIRELERAGREKAAQAIQNTSNILSNLVSPETSRGFRDLMSGFAKSPEALQLLNSTAGEAQRVIDDLRSGRITDIQAVQRLSQSAKGLEITVDRFAQVGGDAAGVYLKATDQTRLANLGLRDQTDLEQRLTAAREKQLSEQNKTTENFIKANKELEVLNRQINAFAFAAVNPATIAVQKFTGAVNEVVRLIGETLGVQLTAGTGTGTTTMAGGSVAAITAAEGGGSAAVNAAARAAGKATPAAAGARASATDILNLVANVESNNNANAMFPNATVSGLTNKTVQEVLALQNQRVTELGLASGAAGKYQIIQKTLADLVNKGVINLNDKFDTGTQERAALALLERRGFGQYQRGEISAEDFANNLAYEFAALPGPNGQSVYNRDGINRARVSREQVMSVLGARNGGILSGPTSGYRATLHGTEAVIPLSSGRSIPVEMPGFTDGIRQLAEVMSNQSGKLDDLIDMMRASNNISKDMLRYQRA